MSAVTGILLFALAVLTFGVALVAARKPNAPAWLTEGFAGSLITITTIAFAVTGVGLVGQFAVSYGREPLGVKELVLISISLILLIAVFTGLVRLVRRPAVVETPAVDTAPSVVANAAVTVLLKDEEGPPMPVKHGPSRSGRRKGVAPKRAA